MSKFDFIRKLLSKGGTEIAGELPEKAASLERGLVKVGDEVIDESGLVRRAGDQLDEVVPQQVEREVFPVSDVGGKPPMLPPPRTPDIPESIKRPGSDDFNFKEDSLYKKIQMSPEARQGAKAAIIGAGGLTAYNLMKGGGEGEQQVVSEKPSTLPSEKKEEVKPEVKRDPFQPPKINKAAVKEENKAKNTIAEMAKQPEVLKMLNLDMNTINTVANLEDAQERRNSAQLINQLGKITERMAAQMGGFTAMNQDVYDANIKKAEDIVGDFKAKAEQEKNDPKSGYSKAYKASAEKILGYPIEGDVSAAALEKMVPGLEKSKEFQANLDQQKRMHDERMTDKQMARDQHADLMKFRYKQMAQDKELAKEAKSKDTKDRYTKEFRKEITSGETGKMYANAKTAERSLSNIEKFAKNPTGYTDYGTLMSSLKTLQGDQSVVRETEIRLGINAADLFTKAENAIQRAINGKSLSDEQRKSIIDAVGTMSKVAKDQFEEATSDTYKQAKRMGLDPEEIFDPGFHGTGKIEKDDDIGSVIKNRSDDENKKRLQELKQKYGR